MIQRWWRVRGQAGQGRRLARARHVLALRRGRWAPLLARARADGLRREFQVRRAVGYVFLLFFVSRSGFLLMLTRGTAATCCCFASQGGARRTIRWETTYWGELGPRGVLLAYVRRSSRGLRAAERALRPRARRHPARGLHPKPPAIYRSVGRRATRGGILWVRVCHCRAAAAAHRRDARPWRGGKQQQDFLFFLFLLLAAGQVGCVGRHTGAREGEGEENKIGNTLSGMHERASPPRA